MKSFKLRFYITAIALLMFSSTTQSNAFLIETYVGVINIQHPYSQSVSNDIIQNETYLLHTIDQTKPLKLIFKNGQPNKPVMTGDKVQVVGLNAANKLFVQSIQSIPEDSIPF